MYDERYQQKRSDRGSISSIDEEFEERFKRVKNMHFNALKCRNLEEADQSQLEGNKEDDLNKSLGLLDNSADRQEPAQEQKVNNVQPDSGASKHGFVDNKSRSLASRKV